MALQWRASPVHCLSLLHWYLRVHGARMGVVVPTGYAPMNCGCLLRACNCCNCCVLSLSDRSCSRSEARESVPLELMACSAGLGNCQYVFFSRSMSSCVGHHVRTGIFCSAAQLNFGATLLPGYLAGGRHPDYSSGDLDNGLQSEWLSLQSSPVKHSRYRSEGASSLRTKDLGHGQWSRLLTAHNFPLDLA